uniref:Alanine--glyoxylate aminotransferase n=1 Tax=Timema monikensis TaxID=170555 RepID=A0A7R9HPC7_9NEOP|nr:unnamed protein product [Timema monikensis]
MNFPIAGKKLFTPGPLGCSRTVKEAMLTDVGSRDTDFIETIRAIRSKLIDIAGISHEEYTSVLLQGSGTFSVEAVLQLSSPRNGAKVSHLKPHTLVTCFCSAYGNRMKVICDTSGIPAEVLEFPENNIVDPDTVSRHLSTPGAEYTTVAVVHCETSSGVINPVEEIGRVVKRLVPDAIYFVDAMSSFGAVPLDVKGGRLDFLVSSANKCLQGVPGFAFVIASKVALAASKGNCRSLSLDAASQWEGLEQNGQFRFTPPTHSLLAFTQALKEYEQQGGLQGRAKRYEENCRVLQEGMKEMGFTKLLSDKHQGYIITSYHFPKHNNFQFNDFYLRLNDLGQVIYPGKTTRANCFRIGNIGELYPEDMRHLLKCVKEVLTDMGIPVPLS